MILNNRFEFKNQIALITLSKSLMKVILKNFLIGLLNPLDCPHHAKADEEIHYREGVVLDKPSKETKGSFVNVGLLKEVQIDKKLNAGVRVTVEMLSSINGTSFYSL